MELRGTHCSGYRPSRYTKINDHNTIGRRWTSLSFACVNTKTHGQLHGVYMREPPMVPVFLWAAGCSDLPRSAALTEAFEEPSRRRPPPEQTLVNRRHENRRDGDAAPAALERKCLSNCKFISE
ncbi:hypothetical protein EYF80_024932 [Liparis tanakae]|uniref:Uncharacterized protein n=1 Tax=Liparis tanakae TaxID=230148 RepID=A0A4Z2HGW1_9TELE|nr:hypothetical protein EYF80_024932 [Liparis tanakae]